MEATTFGPNLALEVAHLGMRRSDYTASCIVKANQENRELLEHVQAVQEALNTFRLYSPETATDLETDGLRDAIATINGRFDGLIPDNGGELTAERITEVKNILSDKTRELTQQLPLKQMDIQTFMDTLTSESEIFRLVVKQFSDFIELLIHRQVRNG